MATREEAAQAHAEANELWESGEYEAARAAQLRAVEIENQVPADEPVEAVAEPEEEEAAEE